MPSLDPKIAKFKFEQFLKKIEETKKHYTEPESLLESTFEFAPLDHVSVLEIKIRPLIKLSFDDHEEKLSEFKPNPWTSILPRATQKEKTMNVNVIT